MNSVYLGKCDKSVRIQGDHIPGEGIPWLTRDGREQIHLRSYNGNVLLKSQVNDMALAELEY